MTGMTFLQIIALGLSALCWLIAGLIPTPVPMAYLSGPPRSVIAKIRWQSWMNSAGAILAAIGVGIQAYQTMGA